MTKEQGIQAAVDFLDAWNEGTEEKPVWQFLDAEGTREVDFAVHFEDFGLDLLDCKTDEERVAEFDAWVESYTSLVDDDEVIYAELGFCFA